MLGVLFVWSSVFLCLNITCGFWFLFDFLISWFLHLTRTFWLRICYPRLIAELVWFECWTRLQLIMSPGGITKLICLTAMSCAEWMSTRGWLGCNKSDLHLFSHRMLVKAWILVRCWKLCFWNTPTGRTCDSFPKILMHLFQDPKHAELQKDLMARRQDHNMYKHQVQNMWAHVVLFVLDTCMLWVKDFAVRTCTAGSEPSAILCFFIFVLFFGNTKNSSSTLFAILCRPSLSATLQKPRSGSIATCGPTSRLRNVPAKGRWKSLNLLDKMARKVAR